ncbi:MAG: hypothetical protein V3V41_04180 [Candidatus Heimdallarchaeota archaeon]
MKKLNILSKMDKVSIYKEINTKNFIKFSIDRVRKLEKQLVDISLEIGDEEITNYYLKKKIPIVQSGGSIEYYEMTKAIKHVLTNAFNIRLLPLD